MKLLVTGGAGYIGSVTTAWLQEQGHEVVVLDNLSTGHRDALPAGTTLEEMDLVTGEGLSDLLSRREIEGVLHFAGKSLVPESLKNPAAYYRANVVGAWRLLEAMRAAGVHRLVFSSTAAVYGRPQAEILTEDHPRIPLTPYGETKRVVEEMLESYRAAYGLGYACLRYFNAVGASLRFGLRERHDPETHLVPLAVRAAREGRPLEIYGNDYDTPDGTCLRDYIHVDDLAEAHALALGRLTPGSILVCNLGNGTGFSVAQVAAMVSRVAGRPLEVRHCPRRPGDPDRLVAGCQRARLQLKWHPRHPGLEEIVASVWEAESRVALPGQGNADSKKEVVTTMQRKPFGAIALAKGFISEEQLHQALERQSALARSGGEKKLLGLIMLEMGFLTNDQLIAILRYYERASRHPAVEGR